MKNAAQKFETHFTQGYFLVEFYGHRYVNENLGRGGGVLYVNDGGFSLQPSALKKIKGAVKGRVNHCGRSCQLIRRRETRRQQAPIVSLIFWAICAAIGGHWRL